MTRFAPLATDHISQLAKLVADSFNMPVEKTEPWLHRSGLEHWRTLHTDEQLTGGLLRIPMAQWYGGRAVSMTGLAGVAISTMGRGRGAGQTLMRETLAEMREEKTALSALYGSTTAFYRRCGYERAGARYLAETPIRDIDARGGPLDVRPLDVQDHAEVQQLQERTVRGQAALQRGPYLWHRVRNPRGAATQGFGFFRNDVLEGYAYLVTESGGSFLDNELEATDVVLTTPDALQTFLGLLAGYRAFFKTARWPSQPNSPLLLALEERWQVELKLDEHWLLRIVHLQEALEQRGYAPHVEAQLHLDLSDPWFPENAGTWVLEVSQGRGHLKKGGRGDLKLAIGALAPLYTGFMSAEDIAIAGKLEGTQDAQAAATAIFGGATPQLADFF